MCFQVLIKVFYILLSVLNMFSYPSLLCLERDLINDSKSRLVGSERSAINY